MGELELQCTCGKKFRCPGKLLEYRLESGITELYYLCPHCREKHHVCFINNEIKNIQKLIDKARARGNADLCRALCNRKKTLMDKLNGR